MRFSTLSADDIHRGNKKDPLLTPGGLRHRAGVLFDKYPLRRLNATSRLLLWRKRSLCVLLGASTATPSFPSIRIISCSNFLVCKSAGSSGRVVFLFDFSFIVVDVGVWIPQRPRMGLKPHQIFFSCHQLTLCSHAAAVQNILDQSWNDFC